jgi:tryptophan halogenase
LNETISRVVVVGDGVPAATAALAIARAFGPLGTEVVWAFRTEDVTRHLALAAPPDIRALHRLLRVDEAHLIRETPATLRTAEQFTGWSGDNGPFIHAYGDAGDAFRSLPFVQHWSRARRAGLRVALEDFCLAAAAAKQIFGKRSVPFTLFCSGTPQIRAASAKPTPSANRNGVSWRSFS